MIRKIKNFGHFILAVGANVIYGFPGNGITVIGITGTDGKTTTANLLHHILTTSGKKVAVISTIGAIVDGKEYDTGFHVTTPSPFAIQKYLKLSKKKKCDYVILEVTSHALDQNRVWGVDFEIGVLTNITHEHLDYHGSYKNYVLTKLRLLQNAKWAVVNSNGEWFGYVKRIIPSDKIASYSLHGEETGDLSLLNLPYKLKTGLIGDFNLENILAATAAANLLKIDTKAIASAVESFKPPIGRQEVVVKKEFTVMVDFAHTANSFERILPTIRKKTTGRLIHVFGAAGERDYAKRAEMGKAAAFYDDIIILTAEDPRSEKISDINTAIKKGIHGFEVREVSETALRKTIYEIEDRKEAIEFALTIARPHDTIIITGKGHESSINYGNGEIPWSDQKVVRDYLSTQT